MQLGFVSAILPDLNLDEVFAFAADEGFACIELMCWPPGSADRRYAGVTHLDQHFIGFRRRHGALGERQHVGRAGFAGSDVAHRGGKGVYDGHVASRSESGGHSNRTRIRASARLRQTFSR